MLYGAIYQPIGPLGYGLCLAGIGLLTGARHSLLTHFQQIRASCGAYWPLQWVLQQTGQGRAYSACHLHLVMGLIVHEA
jgi:hypothetical protein